MVETDNMNGLTKEEAEALIGKNSAYYLPKWYPYAKRNMGFNWAAALLGPIWMCYRKMYVEAFLLILSISIIPWVVDSLMLSLFGNIPYSDSLLGSMVAAYLGSSGNYLYHQKALRTFKKGRHLNNEELLSFLRRKGGVSVVAVSICLIIVISLLVLMILAALY